MKKIIAICVCFMLCLSFTACGNDSDIDVPMGFQLASDPDVPDYVVLVPSNWTVEESTGTTTAYYKDELSGKVIATFTASFNVAESSEITLENYFESYSAEFEQVFEKSETEVESSTTILGGKEAKQYIYTAKFGGVEYKFWQVICLHENRFYTLTYSSTSEYFEKYAEDMEAIIEYFTFSE